MPRGSVSLWVEARALAPAERGRLERKWRIQPLRHDESSPCCVSVCLSLSLSLSLSRALPRCCRRTRPRAGRPRRSDCRRPWELRRLYFLVVKTADPYATHHLDFRKVALPPPEQWELRVVVWKAKEIPPGDPLEVRHGMQCNGTEWDGNGMERKWNRNGTDMAWTWHGMEWNGMEWNTMEYNGMQWKAVEGNGRQWKAIEFME